MRRPLIALALLLALAACRDDQAASPPPPVAMTADALGHYCQMNLTEHPGPKAQVHLAGLPAPLFFSQVRDAIAYQRLPEQSHAIAAVYVNDMAVAPSWEEPGIDNWLLAERAYFVVGSNATGGMAAPELVPFGTQAAAEAFMAEHGGQVLTLAQIPDTAALAPVALEPDIESGDDGDYQDRLRALSANRQD